MSNLNIKNLLNFKNLDFKKKMIFSILPLMMVILVIIGREIYIFSLNSFEKERRKEAHLIAKNCAITLQNEFNIYFEKEKSFSDVVADFKVIDVNVRRQLYVGLIRKFLETNKTVLSYWLGFDRNTFDGKDDQYKNTEYFGAMGHMDVGWHRGTGKIMLIKEENPVELLAQDFYRLPREQRKTIITEPYKYSYNNRTDDAILMTSIVSPIFNEQNQVIGVTGIDVPLENLVNFIDNMEIFNNIGYTTMLSPSGLYLAHPNKELLGKSVMENPNFPENMRDSVNKLVQTGKNFHLDFVSPVDDTRKLVYVEPIILEKTNSHLMVSVFVPYETLVEQASALQIRIVIYFGIALIFLALVVSIVAHKLGSPLKQLSEEAAKLTEGDLSFNLDIASNDEIGELTKTMLFVNQTIKGLIDEINQSIRNVLNGNLKYRANTNKLKGDYGKIMEGVNELVEAFVEPLEIASEFLQSASLGEDLKKIEKEYKGEFNIIKNSVNKLHDTLWVVFDGIIKTAGEAKIGNLDKRVDTSKVQGGWMAIMQSLNEIVESADSIINEAGGVLSTMATGDLTPRITKNYTGKFGAMKNNINHLGDSLSDLVIQLQKAIHTIAASSSEISSTAEILATGIQEQNIQTNEVATAMEQMAHTITKNAHSAAQTAVIAKTSETKANDGSKIVTLTINKMKDIAEVVKDSAANIAKLGDSNNKIGEIINVINNIADQTNLLSLNAAIEAARAGESGKGFAVVADSVGKLAIGTAGATKQIADMIREIQSNTEKAVQAMEKGTMEVQGGIELADNAGTSLQHILGGIDELLNMVNQIANASEQQSLASEDISRSISKISQVSSDSTRNIEDVAHTVSDLARMTENLTLLVSHFKVNINSNNSNSSNSSENNSHSNNDKNDNNKNNDKNKKNENKNDEHSSGNHNPPYPPHPPISIDHRIELK